MLACRVVPGIARIESPGAVASGRVDVAGDSDQASILLQVAGPSIAALTMASSHTSRRADSGGGLRRLACAGHFAPRLDRMFDTAPHWHRVTNHVDDMWRSVPVPGRSRDIRDGSPRATRCSSGCGSVRRCGCVGACDERSSRLVGGASCRRGEDTRTCHTCFSRTNGSTRFLLSAIPIMLFFAAAMRTGGVARAAGSVASSGCRNRHNRCCRGVGDVRGMVTRRSTSEIRNERYPLAAERLPVSDQGPGECIRARRATQRQHPVLYAARPILRWDLFAARLDRRSRH